MITRSLLPIAVPHKSLFAQLVQRSLRLDSQARASEAAKVIELTQSDFHAQVEASAVLVVDFAPSSSTVEGPHPLTQRFPEVTFARIDPLREPAIAAMFGLTAAPALLIFREGIVLYLESGEHPPARIEGLLARITALDLGKIRAAIEKERAETAVHMRRMCPAARRGPLEP